LSYRQRAGIPEGIFSIFRAREAADAERKRIIYLCERCGSRYSSARFAHIELCPRCLLRDDAASHLVYVPGRKTPKAAGPQIPPPARRPTEPDAASAELG
jgi:hypothetical protein